MIRLVHSIQALFRSRRIQGPRVFLRPPRRRDARAWIDLRRRSHAFLSPWEPEWRPEALTRSSYVRQLRSQALAAHQDRGYAFLVFRRGDRALLGGISVSNIRRGVAQSGSLGYWVGAPHARQGYMTEALSVLLPVLFDRVRLHRIEAAAVVGNEASIRLLERIGFRREGRARQYLKIAGAWRDHALYALLAGDLRPMALPSTGEAAGAAGDRGRRAA